MVSLLFHCYIPALPLLLPLPSALRFLLPGTFLSSLADVMAGNAALKDGVIRIVRTFGGRLNAFKFPMGTARKLQGFVDYCG